MSTTSAPIDIDALGKLLSLVKSFDEVFPDRTESKTIESKAIESKAIGSKAIERVLIRTNSEGQLSFQVKGGMLWRFFNITLSGREKAYDLGQNFAQLQSLFRTLKDHSDQEIRRAAQGMCMYGQTVIDTQDAIVALTSLQEILNSILDHIKRKKLRQQPDEERKKSIIEALEAMKIDWKPVPVKESKKKKNEVYGKKD